MRKKSLNVRQYWRPTGKSKYTFKGAPITYDTEKPMAITKEYFESRCIDDVSAISDEQRAFLIAAFGVGRKEKTSETQE